MLLCLMLAVQTGHAQEVDKSRSNKKKLRENRFKTRNKQGDRKHKGDITGRKSKTKRTKTKSKINSPASSPYGNALYRNKAGKKEGKNVKKSGGYYNTPSRPAELHRKGDISGRKPRRSATRPSESRSVKASSNPYAGRKRQSEAKKAKANRIVGGGFQSATRSGEDKKKKRKRIQPRSASKGFVAKRKGSGPASITRRGEQARTKSISGQGLRFKNFSSRKSNRGGKPSFNPYAGRKRRGDQSHAGRKDAGYISKTKKGERKHSGMAGVGGYKSATRKGENAWKKDITGRKFKRPSDPGVVTGKKGKAFTSNGKRRLSISGGIKNNGRKTVNTSGGGGSVSDRVSKGRKSALPRKSLGSPKVSGFAGRFKRFEISPGFDSRSAKYQGNKKGSRKPLKGGGSITNRIKKGKGQALPRKDLGSAKVSGFAGRFKRFEMSPGFDTRSSRYQGNKKGSRKPLKGGGSITSQIKKGKGQALPRKDLGSAKVSGFSGRFKRFEMSPGFDTRSSKYQGNAKGSRKPLKGGGSITSQIKKGKGQALPRKDLRNSKISGFAGRFKRFEISPGFDTRSSSYQGNAKGSRKPLKGGGSISGNRWNNNQTPLNKKYSQNKGIANYKGNRKGAKKPLKGGGSITTSGWNNDQKPIQQKPQSLQNFYGSRYTGTLKMKRKYVKKPNAHEDAQKGKEPHKNMYTMSGYQGKMKDKRNHKKKPNAHEDALKGIAPKKAVAHIDSYIPKYAKRKYTKKPNAHEDAQKGIAPKPSTYKAMAFQGRFKTKKNYDKNMHPSAKYTTSQHPRNSLAEKDRTFKFNIWWAKLFKKNENQPAAVKEKVRTPRYDKREKDLWYE